MNYLESLERYFGTGTAESEKAILNKIFIPFDDYDKILKVLPYSPRLIVGKKGSGKSAFLRFIYLQMQSNKIPTILIKPEDISTGIHSFDSLGELTRIYKLAILKSIATKIGEDTSGFFADSANEQLIKIAQEEGIREQDRIEKLANALKSVGKKVADIDIQDLKNNLKHFNPKKLMKAIEDSLDQSDQIFYLLIDDIDQIASPSEKSHLNRIWAFLLAARSITENMDNMKIIISLRAEVWKRLGTEKAGQRDQVDHFRDLIYHLHPTESKIKKVLLERITQTVKDLKITDKKIDNYNYFFEKDHVKIPGTREEYRYWHDFLSKSSRERPRDAIQLVSELIRQAEKTKTKKINHKHVETVLPIYSEERVDDLRREVEDECPKIKEIIRSFSEFEYDEGAFTMSPEKLIESLKILPSKFSIMVMGNTISDNDLDILFLWKYLFEIGFINARISDSTQKEGYRHITSDNDPELVSKDRWNEMQRMLWEVHPAYRSFLLKEKKSKTFSFGRPTKKKRR